MKCYIYIGIIYALFLLSCDGTDRKTDKSYPTDLPLIDLRGLISEDKKETVSLFSTEDKIEYIQLKDYPKGVGFQDVLATDAHIYVILGHYMGLAIYDREGNLLKQYKEPGFHLFDLFYDEPTGHVFATGWSNTWILDEKTGEPLGDAQSLYRLPTHSVAYPLPGKRLLTLYGKENTDYNTKVGAAICGYDGSRLVDSVYIGKGDEELYACWWSWSTFVMEGEKNDYLFFTFFRGAPYQTIYRADSDKIEPAYYLDIEANTDIRYVWKSGDSLCFIYHLLCGGNILVETNVTFTVYNLKTKQLQSQRLLDKMVVESDRYLGIANAIDGGFPICITNHSEQKRRITDLLTGKNVQAYLQKETVSNRLPVVVKTMNEDSNPVVAIINYKFKF